MSQPPPPQTHPPRLHNKIAIITGSSSGLGRAIALAYASHGTRLIVCADLTPDAPSSDSASSDPHVPDDNDPHSADAQKPTHELICARYGVDKAVFCRTDVGDAGSVEGCVGMAVERGGRLDIMVNNAGVGSDPERKPIHLTTEDFWDTTIRINLRGVFLGCKYACAQFLTQEPGPEGRRGWIVNTSSMLGLVGLAGGASYCASKGGVITLTKQIALDYAPDRIHCNALCPGFTKTPMTKPNYSDARISAEMVAMTPWGGWGLASDVAKAAVFLASGDVAWVTGVALPVDGGYLAQ